MASKQDVLDRLNKAVSKKSHAKFDPLEDAEIKFKKNVKALEHCKNLGIIDCSFLHEKCQLTILRFSPIAAGKESCCEVRVQCKDGSPLSVSTSLVSCQLTASKDPQPADCTIKETGPGKYAIGYTLFSRSGHELRVLVGGVEISGSPFFLAVLPPTPETRGQPLHVAVKGLKVPIGVTLSRSGNIIVSEYYGDCIKIFSPWSIRVSKYKRRLYSCC